MMTSVSRQQSYIKIYLTDSSFLSIPAARTKKKAQQLDINQSIGSYNAGNTLIKTDHMLFLNLTIPSIRNFCIGKGIISAHV